MKPILAIDFGGTRTRAAAFAIERDGLRLIRRMETPSHVHESQSAVIDRLIATGRAVMDGVTPVAIGISAPGPLDPAHGIIYHAHTLPGWENVPLASVVSTAFDNAPTLMHNDANLAAVAEYERGAGRGCDPLIYLTISTGIGGGVVLGGRLFSGWSGLASEPGHQIIPLSDGRLLRLEQLASGTGIGRLATEHLRSTEQASVLRALLPDGITGQSVGEAAAAGDAFAESIITEAGRYLGIGLTNLVHVLSPQAIVIGGSVAQLGERLLGPARAVIEANILDRRFLPTDLLRPAELGDDVCLVGAAYYAYRGASG